MTFALRAQDHAPVYWKRSRSSLAARQRISISVSLHRPVNKRNGLANGFVGHSRTDARGYDRDRIWRQAIERQGRSA